MADCYWRKRDGDCRDGHFCQPYKCPGFMPNELNEPVYDIGDEVWTIEFGEYGTFPTLVHGRVKAITRTKDFPLYEVSDVGECGCCHTRTGFSLFKTKDALKEYYMKIFE